MYTLFVILIVIAAILMIGIVLIQESKGGGLASNFSASNQIMGVRKTTDFLEKATWGLAIALVVLSLLATMVIPRTHTDNTNDKEQTEQTEQTPSATETANN